MAHLIDDSKGFNAFVSVGAPGWHGLGETFDRDINTKEALEFSGLDFKVIKLPNIHCTPGGQEIISKSSFFTLRTDVDKVLGDRLGADYTVLQKLECFDLVDDILEAGRAKIETAGSINGGRKVFICLKMNDGIRVGDNDSIDQYVLIANSHDGSLAITATPTNIRVVCNNTLSAALNGAKGAIRIRHSGKAAERMQEAARVLNLIDDNSKKNEDAYNKMRDIKLAKSQVLDYFGNIFFTPEEIHKLQKGEKDVISSRKANILAEVQNFSENGTGQDMARVKGVDTAWSAYNAITGFIARKQFAGADKRAENMLFGKGADMIRHAAELVLTPEKIQICRPIAPNFNLN